MRPEYLPRAVNPRRLSRGASVIALVVAALTAVELGFGTEAYAFSGRRASQSASQPVPPREPPPEPRDETIWVGKSDEAKQCEDAGADTMGSMAADLEKGGARVLAKRKIRDEKARIQMCGADKGDWNGYLIRKSDLGKAVALGFSALQPQPKP